MPRISVILTVYNVAGCLKACMDSLAAQTFTNYEIICIDDGSTDGSAAILDEYAANDSRIKLFHEKNQGQGTARNYGLTKASGEYVLLLDSDDIFQPDFLQKMYQQAERTNADIVVCRSGALDDATNLRRPTWWTLQISQVPTAEVFSYNDMSDFIFTAFMGWAWDKLYRRDFICAHNLRFPAIRNSEDFYFVFLAFVLAERISIVEDILIWHRQGRSSSVSVSRSRDPRAFYTGICTLKRELQADPDRYCQLRWGFLNWSFDYLIWNIETMDDPQIRSELLQELAAKGFSEVEYQNHDSRWYGLFNDVWTRYQHLLAEESAQKPFPNWRRALHQGIHLARKQGVYSLGIAALGKLAHRMGIRFRNSTNPRSFRCKEVRGSAFVRSQNSCNPTRSQDEC